MATLIKRHDGRVFNLGDAVIAEFPSVVEAVQCAVRRAQRTLTFNSRLALTATDDIPHRDSFDDADGER